jgi:hypothetical protein
MMMLLRVGLGWVVYLNDSECERRIDEHRLQANHAVLSPLSEKGGS